MQQTDFRAGIRIKGLQDEQTVTVLDVQPCKVVMPEVTFQLDDGTVVHRMVYPDEAKRCEIVTESLAPAVTEEERFLRTTLSSVSRSLFYASRKSSPFSYDQHPHGDLVVNDAQVSALCYCLYHHAEELCSTEEDKKKLKLLTKSQLISWGLLHESERGLRPSVGYVLLDDPEEELPEAYIQCALFKGTVRNIFIDRKDCKGPVWQQIKDAYHFVLQNIQLGSRFEGLYRRDSYELPAEAIREMIVNAVCHRDYLSSGRIQVALYDDRLEVVSPGSLPEGMTIDTMLHGASSSRNKGLSMAFNYMHITESWGIGIPKIIKASNNYGLPEPKIAASNGEFRITLFRRPFAFDIDGVVPPSAKVIVGDTDLVRMLRQNPKLTQKQLAGRIGVSLTTVKRLMKSLQKRGTIEHRGSHRAGIWVAR